MVMERSAPQSWQHLISMEMEKYQRFCIILHLQQARQVAYFEGRAARCPGLCPGPWLPQRAGHPGRPGHEGGGGRGRGQRAHCRGDQHSHSLVRGIIVKYYP